ncbi:hypothetical protein [Massilia sp. ST3]|uniref:hypothetical protein n=1 Tax=Massilia sp. ST3 TaxID=2824903 RepID=UPI001B829C84|nr:hypothetical protein [Massilia sp. ST3]MBQ5949348.1 hypothetical protein [Massilia sp. ST3]
MKRMNKQGRHPAPAACLALASALSLAGCASSQTGLENRYSTLPPGARTCSFGPAGELVKLQPGERCYAHVVASERVSLTPLQVDRGERYAVKAPPNQYWSDASHTQQPPKGQDGTWLMQRFDHWKRVRDAKWFALIATVLDIGTLARASTLAQDISCNPEFAVTRQGQLGFFPNDAVAPWGDGGTFYRNNHGEIWVEVRRLGDDHPVTPACVAGKDKAGR